MIHDNCEHKRPWNLFFFHSLLFCHSNSHVYGVTFYLVDLLIENLFIEESLHMFLWEYERNCRHHLPYFLTYPFFSIFWMQTIIVRYKIYSNICLIIKLTIQSYHIWSIISFKILKLTTPENTTYWFFTTNFVPILVGYIIYIHYNFDVVTCSQTAVSYFVANVAPKQLTKDYRIKINELHLGASRFMYIWINNYQCNKMRFNEPVLNGLHN